MGIHTKEIPILQSKMLRDYAYFFCRHHEMRENNHPHLTATSVHSNKLTVLTKHFLGKNICEAKANFINKAWHKNQILEYMQIALAKSRSAIGASQQQPA